MDNKKKLIIGISIVTVLAGGLLLYNYMKNKVFLKNATATLVTYDTPPIEEDLPIEDTTDTNI